MAEEFVEEYNPNPGQGSSDDAVAYSGDSAVAYSGDSGATKSVEEALVESFGTIMGNMAEDIAEIPGMPASEELQANIHSDYMNVESPVEATAPQAESEMDIDF